MMDEKALQNILAPFGLDSSEIMPFKSIEDGTEYDVWKIGSEYVLKKAKGNEIGIYSEFFADGPSGAPRFYSSVKFDGEDYFLMEYAPGKDLCKCDRTSLKKALDALISLQEKYWNAEEHKNCGLSFSESLERRINRGKYLFDSELEEAYSCFISAYGKTPKTLCHDDLLPFNILISEDRATLIDWEVAGILPYPTSLARLIAHTEESGSAMFYMTENDKLFAIDYYYENLVAHHGISYEDYRRTLDLFLLYEYCEWIMLGNKYDDADMELFEKYKAKAKEHIKTMFETYSRLSAYNGDSAAQYDLAQYCESASDIEQAIFWYRKAALQSHVFSIEKCKELEIELDPPKPSRKELKCRIYPINYLKNYKFTVICANYQGKWILSKHKKRDTWETQGGHIEEVETPLECARRELFEESGITDADIYPVCDYWGFNSKACSNGMVFLAVVHSLGELPESEMKEIGIFDSLPEELTYPQVSPRLYEEAAKLMKGISENYG